MTCREFKRDHEEGTITINQKDYTEDIVQRYGMRGCNPAYTPGMGAELSLDQPEPLERRRQAAIPFHHGWVRLCTLRRSAATTSSTPSTSWRGQCPSHLRHTWERPSTYYATWPGPPISRSPTSKKVSNSRLSPTQTGEKTPTGGSLHHHTS